MQPNVDVVNILQINELAAASGVDLTWLLPIGRPGIGTQGSFKYTLQQVAQVISEQIGSVTVPDPEFYVAESGQTTFPDTNLEGADYTLFKWGVGPLEKGVEWQNDVVGGGFRLLNRPAVLNEMYAVFFKPQISNIISAPDAVARFANGIRLFPSSGTISASDFRKMIVLNGAEVLTLPLASAYPPNIALYIVSSDGPRRQSTISTQGGNLIDSSSGNITSLYIGQREFVVLITDGTKWYIQSCSPAIFAQPTLVSGWMYDSLSTYNAIPANGALINRADWPRLTQNILKLKAAIPGAVANSTALWNNNKTLWGLGNGTTTLNVPLLGGVFSRFLDLGAGYDQDRINSGIANIPGTLQGHQFELHTHGWSARRSNDSLGNTGYVTSSNGPGGPEYDTLNTIVTEAGGTETRGINVAFYPLINV